MRVSIVTPCFNSARFLEATVRSILAQRETAGGEVEYIVADGGSTDGSLEILNRYRDRIDRVVSEPDRGPADAINKGLALATGDLLAWLNADDLYAPDAVARVLRRVRERPGRALYFGRCRIVDPEGREIRRGITRFKNAFFPFSCRPMIQTINYVSQPAMFFTRAAFEAAGPLRLDLKAAFDYEFVLRLWRRGGAAVIPGPPVADFRWYPSSISGSNYGRQFQEEFEAAARDAGRFSPQTFLHRFVRDGIVWSYNRMARHRLAAEGGDGETFPPEAPPPPQP